MRTIVFQQISIDIEKITVEDMDSAIPVLHKDVGALTEALRAWRSSSALAGAIQDVEHLGTLCQSFTCPEQ
eukprot:4469475-Pyramimonas_sp.AAC.1